MKEFECSFIKLQYDEHGRLFLKSFKNLRTDNLDYYSKVEAKFFSTVNFETDIIARYDMDRDKLGFLRGFDFMVGCPVFDFSEPNKYNFELSDFMKRYIKAQR